MRPYVVWRTKLLTGMLVALAILVFPLRAAAQQPGHVPRIAFLDLNYPPAVAEPTPLLDAFRQGSSNMDGWRDTPSRLSGAGRRGVSNARSNRTNERKVS